MDTDLKVLDIDTYNVLAIVRYGTVEKRGTVSDIYRGGER